MPNWAAGTMKIRGTRENIKNLLMSELKPIQSFRQTIAQIKGKEIEPLEVEIKEDEWDFIMKSPNGLHISGTSRAFIEGPIEWFFSDQAEEVLTITTFRQAWAVDAEPFAEISERYDVDIKIHVFERGMEFNQEIEIHKGNVIRNETIKFENYEWECLMPHLGG